MPPTPASVNFEEGKGAPGTQMDISPSLPAGSQQPGESAWDDRGHHFHPPLLAVMDPPPLSEQQNVKDCFPFQKQCESVSSRGTREVCVREFLAGMSVKSLGFAEPDAGRPAWGVGREGGASMPAEGRRKKGKKNNRSSGKCKDPRWLQPGSWQSTLPAACTGLLHQH